MQYIISDIDGNGTDYRRSFNNFGLTKEIFKHNYKKSQFLFGWNGKDLR